jgi:hypothetical protein
VNFNNVIRNDLDRIQWDANTTATFELYTDTGVQDSTGHPAKTHISITTIVLLSPCKHDEKWDGKGIDETADLKCIVHRLVQGGVDYINSEYFTRNNIRNVIVDIGTRKYKVVWKRAHPELSTITPYHVLYLQQMCDT